MPSDGGPPRSSARHIAALDGLRGVAILMVMTFHFAGPETYSRAGLAFSRLAGAGWIGVDLFFALSGYLITGILCDTSKSKHYYRNFYIRRGLRIFPLYYAVLLFYFIAVPLTVGIASGGYREVCHRQLWCWLYAVNIKEAIYGGFYFDAPGISLGHFWSLAVEEQFYILWPFVVKVLSRSSMSKLCLFSICGALILRIALWVSHAPAISAYTFTFCRADDLIIGCYLALLERRNPSGLDGYRGLLQCVTGILAVALLVMFAMNGGLWWWDARVWTFGFTFTGLLCGCLVGLAANRSTTSLYSRILSLKSLRKIGKYSYGIYIFHIPVRNIVMNHLSWLNVVAPTSNAYIIVILARVIIPSILSIVVAFLSYHLFEKRFLALKRLFPSNELRSSIPTRSPSGG